MLNADEINFHIARLEYEESSYPNYAKLADLYAIRNEMYKGRAIETAQSFSAPPITNVYGDSEFLNAVRGKDSASCWEVMDELMSTLAVVNERVYNRVMEKINEL